MSVKSTIFEKLLMHNICYAVCVSLNSFKLNSIDEYSRDYFLVSSMDDYTVTHKLGFIVNKNIPQYELSGSEVQEFKNLQNRFTKVIHNNDGRVYELKDNSFKAYFNKLKSKTNVSKSSNFIRECWS